MALPFYNWSKTASSNATADSTVNWAEGQSPSSVNDSARAMMASTAAFRDDISGAIVTGGTSTAYTVSSFQVFDTLAHLNGQMVAFTPHTTSGATVTLNVDGLGAKPLRSAPSTELLAGVLIQGTPYIAVYSNSDSAFYLHGFYGNPYNVPLLGGLDYWDTVAPNSSFIFPAGQAINRTTYAAAFARWGTTFGVGDGSTTFNVPDVRGRVRAMLETAASRLTSTYFGAATGQNGSQFGATGGGESHTLTTPEIPSHTHVNTLTDNGHSHGVTHASDGTGGSADVTVGAGSHAVNDRTATATSNITINNVAAGGGNPHAIVQPTIVCNYIIRII